MAVFALMAVALPASALGDVCVHIDGVPRNARGDSDCFSGAEGSGNVAVAVNGGTAVADGGTRNKAIAVNGGPAFAGTGDSNTAISVNSPDADFVNADGGNGNRAIGVAVTEGVGAGDGHDNTSIGVHADTAGIGVDSNGSRAIAVQDSTALIFGPDNSTAIGVNGSEACLFDDRQDLALVEVANRVVRGTSDCP